MKIATWNIERLRHYKDMGIMLGECGKAGADILVLTETDDRMVSITEWNRDKRLSDHKGIAVEMCSKNSKTSISGNAMNKSNGQDS